MKKRMIFFIILIISLNLISSAKLDVSTTKDTFKPEENISFRVSLLDSENNQIQDTVKVTIENAEKTKKIIKNILSNKLIEINLEKGATNGYWSIKAEYNNQTALGIFIIEAQELAKFELKDDKLTITNMGNTKYTKTIQIIIGNTIGIRKPNLEVGESIFYRLVAPRGEYNIKITDGTTTLEKNKVSLTGTGKAIGAIDQRTSERSPLTGGIAPDDKSDLALISYFKKNKLIYLFIFSVFGAGILLAIVKRNKNIN